MRGFGDLGHAAHPASKSPDSGFDIAVNSFFERPFIVLNEGNALGLEATEGPSFSTPSQLRLGAGQRRHFGDNLGMLAIPGAPHSTDACVFPCEAIGRGRVARSVQDIVLCDDDNTYRVVYQSSVAPTRYIGDPIPLPSGTIPALHND